MKRPAKNFAGGYGIGLDFHHRFSQFCLSTYAVCHCIYTTDMHEREALARASLDHAVEILLWLQDLSPVDQESLRYISDFAFVMLLFTCLFIIQACESPYMVPEERSRKLQTVSTTARLLVDLGIHASHFPSVYGKSLQRRVGSLQGSICLDLEPEFWVKDSDPDVLTMWSEPDSNFGQGLWRQGGEASSEALFDDLLNISHLDLSHPIR